MYFHNNVHIFTSNVGFPSSPSRAGVEGRETDPGSVISVYVMGGWREKAELVKRRPARAMECILWQGRSLGMQEGEE